MGGLRIRNERDVKIIQIVVAWNPKGIYHTENWTLQRGQ
jgi:hypothetical protein